MTQDREIILYHYDFSPYAKRVIWYLNLRGIPYSQCKVPVTMPRPEVEAIGTKYRRIPILTIGKDIYNDTRLILSKLEQLFPDGKSISAQGVEQKAIEKLLEIWAVEAGGLFVRAVQLLPSDAPLLKDEKFLKDREEYTGRSWSKENIDKQRPEALVEMKGNFEFLENTLLKDGREWLLKTEGPSLADIEAIWALHWIRRIPDALPSNLLSAKQFPKVHAWIDRFDAAVRAAGKSAGNIKTLNASEATKQIGRSGFAEKEGEVDGNDPTGLKKREEVELIQALRGRIRGKLVSLTGEEIVVESQTEEGKTVRVHAPRHGFRLRGVGKI